MRHMLRLLPLLLLLCIAGCGEDSGTTSRSGGSSGNTAMLPGTTTALPEATTTLRENTSGNSVQPEERYVDPEGLLIDMAERLTAAGIECIESPGYYERDPDKRVPGMPIMTTECMPESLGIQVALFAHAPEDTITDSEAFWREIQCEDVGGGPYEGSTVYGEHWSADAAGGEGDETLEAETEQRVAEILGGQVLDSCNN